MGNLYFLRHCKTQFNADGMISGCLDSELIENEITYQEEMMNWDNVTIFSSDLMRCKKTLGILLENIRISPVIVYTSALRERNMGLFEGKRRSDLQKKYPQYFINQRFCHQFTPPQGESFYDFLQRVDGFINNEFLPYKNRNVQENFIICAHNQILKLLYCRLQNVSIEENWMSLDFPSGTVVKIYP